MAGFAHSISVKQYTKTSKGQLIVASFKPVRQFIAECWDSLTNSRPDLCSSRYGEMIFPLHAPRHYMRQLHTRTAIQSIPNQEKLILYYRQTSSTFIYKPWHRAVQLLHQLSCSNNGMHIFSQITKKSPFSEKIFDQDRQKTPMVATSKTKLLSVRGLKSVCTCDAFNFKPLPKTNTTYTFVYQLQRGKGLVMH